MLLMSSVGSVAGWKKAACYRVGMNNVDHWYFGDNIWRNMVVGNLAAGCIDEILAITQPGWRFAKHY